MSIVRGRIKNGMLEFDGPLPVEWPDGAAVETRLTSEESNLGWGMREEDWPTTPEGIATLLKEMEALEPLSMSQEEIEAFDRALLENKSWQIGQFDKWTAAAEEAIR